MRQDVSTAARVTTLFRQSATRSARERLFGAVTLIMPPSSLLSLTVALLCLLLLGLVTWTVEIPQRARAVGVLMPPDGLIDIVAAAPGRVDSINVSEGQTISAGSLLLNITSGQEQLARHQLRAVHDEISLLREARARQVAIDHNRLLALAEQRESLRKRLAAARTEYDLQLDQVKLNERRLARRRALTGTGSLAAEALDQERSMLLQSRARSAALRQKILAYEQDAAALARSRAEAVDESARQQVLHELQQHRLQRQVDEHEHLLTQEIRASEAGVVARVNVRPGVAVLAGQALLKVYRPHQELEAWLYLSSTDAGFLRAGQRVQLRLDAYPYQLFGASGAVVTSVSRIAIVPREINVPLTLSGPVFEVRARLDEAQKRAFNKEWPLAPGTSFQADLVQRRYRLYEWLLRAVMDGSADKRA